MAGYRERIYAQYLQTGGSEPDKRELLGPRAASLSKLIREQFPEDKEAAILDLGCGHGAIVYFAHQAGYGNTIGVDRSEAQVAAAARLGISGISEADVLEKLNSLPEATQDVVIAFDVMEHFTKDELLGCLDQIWRVLKPGGKCIMHAPNGASPFCGRIRYGDITHELALTQESLSQVCRACGFSRITCYEDQPVAHGFKSGMRWLLWQFIRGLVRFYIAAETGVFDSRMIISQNLFCIAVK
jgi:2-polyprenyl-3-methyl-5-hydroxy-6-metoxy-1,4-benzoquinol methylase